MLLVTAHRKWRQMGKKLEVAIFSKSLNWVENWYLYILNPCSCHHVNIFSNSSIVLAVRLAQTLRPNITKEGKYFFLTFSAPFPLYHLCPNFQGSLSLIQGSFFGEKLRNPHTLKKSGKSFWYRLYVGLICLKFY